MFIVIYIPTINPLVELSKEVGAGNVGDVIARAFASQRAFLEDALCRLQIF